MTRWDGLFADLEAQAGRLAADERAGEVDDRVRGEFGVITLTQRLRPSTGSPLRIDVAGGLRVGGTLVRLGPDWLLLDEGAGRETVVAAAAVTAVAGASRWSAAAGSEGRVAARLGLRAVLRGVARDRSGVRVHLTDGAVVDATIDRVGADFVELAVHPPGEARRRDTVREVLVVPTGALAAVRRDL